MPEPKHILQRWPPLGRLALFALVYCGCASLGLRLMPPGEHISPMWPSSGVLLAGLLLSRSRHWPFLLGVAILLEPFAYTPGHWPHLASFVYSTGNTLEGLAGAFVLRRYAGFRHSLERVRDVLSLLGFCVLLSPLLSAAPNVTLHALRGQLPWADFGRELRVFWVGDAMGILLVAPLVLSWSIRGLEGWSRARRLELVALLGTLLATVHLVFHLGPDAISVFHPASSVAFPFILWAALRFEARGTAAAMLVLSLVALSHTLAGSGPFVLGPEGASAPTANLVFLQSFLAAVAVSGLLLASALGERRLAQEKATHLNRELRQSLEELAAAQHELVRRERLAALGELSASIAHEVRNPLGVIANSVAALSRLAPPELHEGPAWQLLCVMGEEVARLDHLVNGLLDFARPIEPHLFTQSLGGVVEGALEASLRSEPGAGRVQVTRVLDAQLPEAPVDAQLLHLALSNLFINALQAMPRGGTLRVELGRGEPLEGTPQAHLTITDSGPGIPPDVMERMFEPFYTTKAAGTGLGLAIVRRIIEAHHGQVQVRTTPGQGTAFIVLLPLAGASRVPSAA
ncbi:MASE1 domain-containing protein [Archangium sp.]|uniref:MASE1 domain-containing protein n=1 Tax=Archangium sp. TaxID=1872627 RepID=UPI00389AC879